MRYATKILLLAFVLCKNIALSAACNPFALPQNLTPGGILYVPFTIVNNSSSVATSDLYVTIIGTNPTTGNSCAVQLSAGESLQWFGTLVDASVGMFAQTQNPSAGSFRIYTPFSYQVSLFPIQNGRPVIYLPPIENATMYISIGYPMGLQTSTSAPIIIQPTQLFTTTDPNYYHLYDTSLFFTIGNDLVIQSQYENGFGLPISTIVSTNNGTSVQYAGIAATRSTLFNNFNTAFTSISNANAKTQWQKLPLSFTSAGAGGSSTQLRIASTLQAMSFSSSPFDTTYLFNAGSYVTNWANTVFNTMTPHLYLDVSGLTTANTTYTYYEYTGISGGNLVFTPGAGSSPAVQTVLIPYPFATSLPFLNAAATGAGSFNASGDSLAAPLISNYLAAGFVSGLFPVTTNTNNLFSDDYLALANVNGQLYQNNSAFPANTGPWYDLYGQVLHQAAAGSSYFNFEADVVDSDLGFFAPIDVTNSLNSQPAVFVILNNLGTTVVPNFTDTNTYTILIAPDPSINWSIEYNGMNPTSFTTGAQTISNVQVPFILSIKYPNNLQYTSQIWVNSPTTQNYSVIFPQPPGVINPSLTPGGWNIGIPAYP